MMIPYPFMIYPVLNLPNSNILRPPLVCDILNSMINFGKSPEEQVSISGLPAAATDIIFDFEYPLSLNVNKKDFETMILKKFYTRRIGYETYTIWKMKLEVKLNEIMPTYNKLFDAMSNWDLFKDGENYTRTIKDIKEGTQNTTTASDITNSVDNIRKFSSLPQNEIQDIENNSYMTDYTHETNSGNSHSTGTGTNNTNENSDTLERFEKDVGNKIEIYNRFLENRNHIMSLIYKELDVLFYGLSNYN